MELHRFGADDLDDVRAFVEVQNAVRAVDSPWEHPRTEHEAAGQLRHGWDGEPPIPFLATVDGKVVGFAEYHTSEWDNQHLAGLDVAVHPAHRRHGYGTAILEALVERARSEGRTSVIIGAWDAPAATAFAAKHGLEQKLVAVIRRQFPKTLDRDLLAGLYDEALAHASAYELVRVAGRERGRRPGRAGGDDRGDQRRAHRRPRHRGRGVHRRADPRLRGGADRAGPPAPPRPGPAPRDRRAGRPHDRRRRRRATAPRRAARHVGRARAPRPPARAAAEARHAALAGRGRAAGRGRSTPGTPSRTTT